MRSDGGNRNHERNLKMDPSDVKTRIKEGAEGSSASVNPGIRARLNRTLGVKVYGR